MPVSKKRSGDVALIGIASPPVNALGIGNGTVSAIAAGLAEAAADPAVAAIVDPAIDAPIVAYAREIGVARRSIPAQEIVALLVKLAEEGRTVGSLNG